MSKKIAAAFAAALALALFAPAAQAQKALVYCPVGIDATGCDRIVAALQPKFPDGVERGYDGTNSTVDLMKVDLEHFAVIVVPSLADDDTKQPYSVLRKAAARLHLAVNGRVAVYSGAPDQGSANRADKDAIIQNLAAWSAKGHTRATGLVGLVAFLDLSENASARYSWVKSVSLADVSADAETQSIADLTPSGRGGDLLASAGRAIRFSNMASYGLHIGARAAARTEVGAMSTTTDSHQSVLVTYANADGKDLGTNGGRPGGASLDVSGGGGSGPTLTTDKPDYLPGDTVLFSGTGWAPNDTVTITVHEDPQWSNPDRTVTAVADGNGNLTSHEFVVQQRDFGVTLTATGVGNPSGLVAQVTFTDGNLNSLSNLSPTSASVVAGNSAPFGFTVKVTGPSPVCTIKLTVSSLPTGASGSFDNDTVRATGGGNQIASRTLTVATLPSAPPITNAPFTVTATAQSDCGNAGGTETSDGTLTITAPPGPTKFAFPNLAVTGSVNQCLPINIQTQNAGGTPTAVASNTNVNLTTDNGSPGGAGAFYNSNTCTATTTTIQINSGSSSGTLFYEATARGSGTHTVTVAAAGLTQASQGETINKANQTALAITAPTTGIFGDKLTITTTGGSGTGALSFSAGASTACSIITTPGPDLNKLQITSGTGTCSITATKATDNDFNSVTSAPQTVTVSKATPAFSNLSSQTITFGTPTTTFTGKLASGALFPTGNVSITLGTTPTVNQAAAIALDGTFSSTFNTAAVPASPTPYTMTYAFTADNNFAAANDAATTLTVNKANQTITFAALPNKTFGDADFTVTATATSGLAVTFSVGATDQCTISVALVHLTGAGSCTVKADQAGNSNYNAASQVPQTFSIAKANQTITFAPLANKTYGDPDFTVSATASSGLAVTFTVGATDQCTISGTTVHLTGAGSCTVKADQGGNNNYNAAPQVTQTFTIAKKTLTVATLSANNKTYDGNNIATLTGGTLAGVVAGDEANVSLDISTATATFSDAFAGTNKLVTATGLGLSGGAKGNYVLSPTTATTHANIDQKSLTASITATGKEYDGTTTVTGTVNCSVATKVGTDDVSCTASGAVFDSPNAGSRTVNANVALSGAAKDNYTLGVQTTASTSATITQKALTIKADDKEKTYDALPFSPFTVSYMGLIPADADAGPQPKSGVLSGAVTFGGTAVGAVNAGTYAITPQGVTATNYAISFNSGTLKIDKANATITAAGFSGPYDGQPHPGSCSAAGVNNASVPTTSTYTPGPAAPVNAGSYTLTCAVSAQQNYNDASVNKYITIAKVALTVKADDQSKTYDGATFSPFTSNIAGFVNNETNGVVSGTVTYTGPATTAVNAGTYAITPVVTGLSATNYTFTPVDGSLVIKQKPLSITADDKEKTYDALPFSPFTVSYAGLIAADADAGPQPKAGVLSTAVTFGGNAVGAVNAGSYTITPSGATATNYAISFGNGTLKIDKANATITAVGFSGPYDGQPHPGSCSATGVNNVNVPTTSTYTPGPAAPVNAGSYTLTCAVSGQQNYNDASVNKYITITKVALTVKADDQSKTYDGATFSPFTSNIAGFVNNETNGVVSGTVTYTGPATTAVNAGTYAITPVVTGLSATNYTFTPVNGSLVIKQAPLSITADDKEKTYDALPFSPFTASYVGLIAADADPGPQPKSGVLSGPVTFGGTAVGAVNAGTYTITPQGVSATNYVISFNSGTLKIDKANATISAAGFSGPYDGQPHPGSCSATGVNNVNVPTTSAYTPGPAAPVDAGSYTLTCAVSGQQNYNDASVNKYITITKVALTVKADDQSKTYDHTTFSPFTSKITGFVNNEGTSVVSGTVTYTGPATTAINAGTYAITPVITGLSATNYTFTPSNGSLVIKQQPASVTPNPASKAYGDPDPNPLTTGTLSGFLAVDNVTATYSRLPTGDTPTTYTISASLSATGLLSNYSITSNTAVFTITNDTPIIATLTGPPGPVALGSPVTVTGTFNDHGFAGDAYVISSTWKSGANSVNVPNVGANSYNGNAGTFSITAPSSIPTGVYTVTVIVTDKWQAASAPVSVGGYVVVYDPNGGFVTGGGWINSPDGACLLTPDCLHVTGKATFGFVSKYKKGQSTPDGDTEFQFHEGNLNFKSTAYDWLVLAGTKAQYKGSGTINGSGDYGFMLTAIDGDLKSKGSPDTFRIKIWDKATGNTVYDNQPLASDSADPTTALGGGSIQIHGN